MSRRTEREGERTAALESRLGLLQESLERSRQESQATLTSELRESRRELAAEQEIARKEQRESIGQFGTRLDALRESLSADQSKGRNESREVLTQSVAALTEQFRLLQESNERKLAEIQTQVDAKLSETITRNEGLFKGVTERLTELHATNEKIQRFSQELEELQGILKAPKLRGELGEIEMERMLRDCLHPEQFEIQYPLGNGRVDAVIKNPQGWLPVDSKFPLEAYNRLRAAEDEATAEAARKEFVRAVKKHVDDIASKYIRPPETLLFAVMYVPAEGVYYEVLSNSDLMEYARRKGVYPTSPTSFWALLQVTVIGFKGMQISESARRITGLLRGLGDDLLKVRTSFDKASKQVQQASTNLDAANKDLDKFERKLGTIQHESAQEELPSSGEDKLLPEADGAPWES
ncbi:MAG: DNA recombination protein RmuC [Calditrichaeota bacterium]|nr:DNA recombination protein RmuC [Calditrichota bacterium]MCB9391487.1 DNA recombination protein RmuC [Calditrichota bacterium]